ncbi:aminoglycoside phosphotransferase [Actibacterium atlanticum]|uniref:Aminoglycoside phosphotransferase n=1 Tax=Actibacterium atlanticum TaxID=1461693 RepID=A0A058ZL77_9RHOB|nr:fructosamine kinase family protein [Actibacterium atlanticum]KCV81556.1 aminoglycoside phosphotransferase [Actibacterium atlanticum]
MAEGLLDKVERLMGQPVTGFTPLHGGDLSEVYKVDLTDGRTVAIKLGAYVDAEARMLRAIAQSGAPCPTVLATQGDVLIMTLEQEVPADPSGWASLGRALRQLHDTMGTHYGWEQDYAFGPAIIPNAPRHSWPDFWGEQRLLALAPDLPGDVVKRLETLNKRLPDLLPAHPTPSLLHGDLWTGNVLFTLQGGKLIDPACYYGDAEVDLAMLHLFGAPGPQFIDSYGALPEGWQMRRALYQLWPALVHLRLFGAGYRDMVEKRLKAVGS